MKGMRAIPRAATGLFSGFTFELQVAVFDYLLRDSPYSICRAERLSFAR